MGRRSLHMSRVDWGEEAYCKPVAADGSLRVGWVGRVAPLTRNPQRKASPSTKAPAPAPPPPSPPPPPMPFPPAVPLQPPPRTSRSAASSAATSCSAALAESSASWPRCNGSLAQRSPSSETLQRTHASSLNSTCCTRSTHERSA
eukprot:5904907-Pleurochrysis_carterae.AAC.1